MPTLITAGHYVLYREFHYLPGTRDETDLLTHLKTEARSRESDSGFLTPKPQPLTTIPHAFSHWGAIV